MGAVQPARKYLIRRPAPDGSRIAATLLTVLLVLICIGPRIRVGGLGELNIDIRTQDLLLAPAMLYLAFSRKPEHKNPLFAALGWALPAFIWCALMVTTTSAASAKNLEVMASSLGAT